MQPAELLATSNENLLKFYKRAIELQGGKGPHDLDQLDKEILRRMNQRSIARNNENEVGDEHDQFS